MRTSLGVLTALGLAAAAPIAGAHEGHGAAQHAASWWHYLLEPVHAPATVLGAAALALLATRLAGARRRRAVQRRCD